MIPRDFIDTLLARVDIVDVIDQHVPLKKSGANHMACCPFHREKSPSFSVSQSKQFYYCFGCGAGGNAIQFVMDHLGMSFVEAIEYLARQVGLEVPHVQNQTQRQNQQAIQQHKNELFELTLAATQFFKAKLKQSTKAIHYLKNRGLSGQTAAKFWLGYAPDDFHALERHFSPSLRKPLIEAGLLSQNEKGTFDRFRDRVIFPIRNIRGVVVGFGGRVIDAGEPKYLNSPETPLFSKSHELYGLFEARAAIREHDQVLVVEGYMDVVMLAQQGIGYAVATLGTAISAHHLTSLMRQAGKIIFCFDGDAAGERAAWRALELALEKADDVHQFLFLFLPEGEDPDSFAQQFGRAALEEALKTQTLALSQYVLQKLSAGKNLSLAEDRAQLLHAAKALLLKVQAPALGLTLRQELAKMTAMTLEDLDIHFGVRRHSVRKKTPATALKTEKNLSLEDKLTRQLLLFPHFARWIHFEALPDLPNLDFFRKLAQLILQEQWQHAAQIFEHFRNQHDIQKQLMQLLQSADAAPIEEEGAALEFQAGLRDLFTKKKQLRITELGSIKNPSEQEKQELLYLLNTTKK